MADYLELARCSAAHLRGGAAVATNSTQTSACPTLGPAKSSPVAALPDVGAGDGCSPKPAITRVPDGAEGDLADGATGGYSPLPRWACFSTALPAPMQLGKVEFDDGTWRTGFAATVRPRPAMDMPFGSAAAGAVQRWARGAGD